MRPNNRFNQQSKRCNTGQTIHCCGKNCTTDPKKTIEKLSEKFICANLCTECHVANEGKNGRHEISLLAEEIRRAHGFQIDIDFIDRFSLRSMSNVASRLKRRKTLEHDFLSHIIWKSKPNQSNPNSTRADANERARSDFFFFWFLVTHFHHFVHFLLADTITHTQFSHNRTYLTIRCHLIGTFWHFRTRAIRLKSEFNCYHLHTYISNFFSNFTFLLKLAELSWHWR